MDNIYVQSKKMTQRRLCYMLAVLTVCVITRLVFMNLQQSKSFIGNLAKFQNSKVVNTTTNTGKYSAKLLEPKSRECLKSYFDDVLLIIIYHYPFYDTIPLLKSFYKDAFKSIVICGPKSSPHYEIMVVKIYKGYYGYECTGVAIRRYPNYKGYLYVNDDMLVNWWRFSKLDKNKLWPGSKISPKIVHIMGHRPIDDRWPWWRRKSNAAETCEKSYAEIKRKYNASPIINITQLEVRHLKNCPGGKPCCLRMWSDLFYIPKRLSDKFQRMSFIFHKNRVFLETAVPTIMSLLESRDEWVKHYGIYLPRKYGSINFANGTLVWANYNYNINFIHPVKFHSNASAKNRNKLKNEIMRYSKRFLMC